MTQRPNNIYCGRFNQFSTHWRSQKFWLGGGGQNGKILWHYFDDVISVT